MAIDRDYARKLGETLRYYRERAGKSQEYVARELGYRGGTSLTYIEAGRSYPQIHHLPVLAALYGVSVDTLLNLYIPPTVIPASDERCGYTDTRSRRCTGLWGHDGYHAFVSEEES